MTITADARGSASTAAGPPTSSHLPNETARPGVVSPYGMTPTASGDPHGGAAAAPRGSETSTAEPAGHTPSPHQLPPAPLQARIVAGVIDLVIGSLLVGGLTSAIWQVGGRPVLTSGLIAFGVVVGARWLAIATTGWSLGGRLLSIRMLGARNQAPSPLGSFLHADLILAVSISTLGLGGIALMRTAAADPEGRGWHDKLSGMVLLSARRAKRPNRPTPSATQPERRPVAEPAPTGRRAAAVSEVPRQSSSQNIGEAWDAARRVSLSSSPTEQSAASQEPAATPSSQAAGEQDESASHRQPFERTGRKAEKKARKAAQARKRGSRPSLTSRRADQGAAQGAEHVTTAGAQSATDAGVTDSSGRTTHPTTSDPVSSSIRRPRPARPARPGRPARHAGRALAAGSSSAAAYTSGASAEGYGMSMDPAATAATPWTTAKAAKAATVSSSPSAKSAASTGPAVSDADAEAVAAASATPVDPQASTAMSVAQVVSRPAVEKPSKPAAGSAEKDAFTAVPREPADAAAPPQEDTEATSSSTASSTSPEPTSATPIKKQVKKRSVPAPSGSASQMDAETATLHAVEDDSSESTDGAERPSPQTHAPPSSQRPSDTTTPSAESSKTAADSEAPQSSTSRDATSTPQVPRSKATKPVTSQTMEPRHAHTQRWRNQSGHTGKKASGSSAAPAGDQREPVSQPGVPRRESLFTTERQRFAAGAGPAPEVAHTFDTSSILPSADRNTQALIDSVPWSSVPTSVDAATVDSLPDGVIISDDGLSQQPEEASTSPQRTSPLDLTNPDTVPGGVPASSEGDAHPTVRSHRSHARASADSATSTAAPEGSSPRRSHASHRFQGPGFPSPADEQAAPDEPRSDAQATEAGDTRHEHRAPAQAQSRTGTSRRSASSGMPEAATPASASAGVSLPPATPVPAASPQAATPPLPSASSAAPALSVRLVPLLGGNPILIHEPTVVGRDPDNISAYPGAERVALDDPTRSVSKTHAAIFPLLDGVWVTDLHSTNGTRVEYRDGRTVEAVPDKALSALEGSTIFFGRVAFKVEVV